MTKDTEPKSIAVTSSDMREERLAKLKALFPDLFDGEGQLDEKALRALVSEGGATSPERFRFEWAGKQQSKRFAFTPSRATLEYDASRSLNRDGSPSTGELADNDSENLIIEADNLEALKLLKASYFERVKCIYIDPPYNTGKDFIYPDDYSETKKAYWQKNGMMQDGVRLTAVTEANGRRHSNWLNFMQARLLLARQLLRDDGFIVLSIDNNELHNLLKLCDEIFGEENRISVIVWEKTRKNDAKFVSNGHDYMLVYAKNEGFLRSEGVKLREEKPGSYEINAEYQRLLKIHGDDITSIQEGIRNFFRELPKSHLSKKHSRYGNIDERGIWRDDNMSWPGGGGPEYDVIHPKTGKPCAVPEGGWRYSTPEKMQEMIEAGVVVFREDHTEPPIRKTYLVRSNMPDENGDFIEESDGDFAIQVMGSYFYRSALQASRTLTSLMDSKVFENPKDHEVLSRIISYFTGANDITLDFFAGSGSTAHAVMQKNAEDGSKCKYILVQIPEYTDEKSEAYKAGYKTISQICIERVKRAGAKIREENPDADIDTGFRVFKLTKSHFPQNLFTPDPDKSEADNLKALEEHLVAASQRDLFGADDFAHVVTEIALKNGFGLFYALERLDDFTANAIYRLSGNDKATLLCLDNSLQDSTVEALEAHSNKQLIVRKHALDTTKKFSLQTAFKDNLRTV